MISRCITTILSCLLVIWATAQGQNFESYELQELRSIFANQLYDHAYSKDDIGQIRITDFSYSHQNGASHIYFQQTKQDLDIIGAVGNMTLTPYKNYLNGNDFIRLTQWDVRKEKSEMPVTALIEQAAKQLKIPFPKVEEEHSKEKARNERLFTSNFSVSEMVVHEVWFPENGKLINALKIEFESSVSSDYWSLIVRKSDASILQKDNYTLYCNFSLPAHNNIRSNQCHHFEEKNSLQAEEMMDGARYRVYAAPLESPAHGNQTIEVQPSNPSASPFGWHDTDGFEGPEYTITRGNNAHAFQDTTNNNTSNGDEPDGGDDLEFIFAHDQSLHPHDNINADVTNLFYWNNLTHDWAYLLGFDEVSGNFQENNYQSGGQGGDYVRVHALDGGDVGNANFLTPSDGSNARMQMYRWRIGANLEISEPPELAGGYSTGNASFGPRLPESLSGQLVAAIDGIGDPLDGCTDFLNSEAINGNIALIDRGECHFSEKVYRAQLDGAVACVICNNIEDGGVVAMGGGTNAELVSIPSLSISKEDCDVIRALLAQDVTIDGRITNNVKELSSGFDNGVITHEYTHGISMRLTGGPSNSGCMSNDEQHGEGWSDFIALVLTQQIDDEGSKPRGIGTYLLGEPTDGLGIRRFRYSTDMDICPLTHGYIRYTSRPHPVGEVWAAVMWDLYWRLIDEYGYDHSWQDKSSGNFIAIRLAFESLKIQPCNSSFLEARDAVLRADEVNNNGVNKCLIWEVFARRGLGFDAEDGGAGNRMDNIDGFETIPSCLNRLSIVKDIPASVNPGEIIDIQVSVTNNTNETANNVVVFDEISTGMSLIEGSVSRTFKFQDNDLTIELGSIKPGQTAKYAYKIRGDDLIPGNFQLFENFEGNAGFIASRSNESISNFELTTEDAQGGVTAFQVVGDSLTGESYLQLTEPVFIEGNNPRLKYFQKFETQAGIDGGVVEYSLDGNSWIPFKSRDFLHNPYNEVIALDPFYVNTLEAFSGILNDWQEVHINLSDLNNQEVFIRFRYIRQAFNENGSTQGWLIDNAEILSTSDIFTTTCAVYNDDQEDCIDSRTMVNSIARTVSNLNSNKESNRFELFPNPTFQRLQIAMNLEDNLDGEIQIFDHSGKSIFVEQRKFNRGSQIHTVDLSSLASGTYLIRIISADEIWNSKFVKVAF